MNEFSLIDAFFKPLGSARKDVVFGIGDDAACVQVPPGLQLLISTDTLVAGVHFRSDWPPYAIASKAVRANVSDIAAMAAYPCWLSLALTLPEPNTSWLHDFAEGIRDNLQEFSIALIGGDITRGPLSITITIHGLIPEGKALRRSGAKRGDLIYVSGELGAAALAVELEVDETIESADKKIVMQKLQFPAPRVDLAHALQTYASAAIDISDGLTADLNHICQASRVGARIFLDAIPIHPLVGKYHPKKAIRLALEGGDDYELCFTVSPENEKALVGLIAKSGLSCYAIGCIEEEGFYTVSKKGKIMAYNPQGYNHFL